MNNRMVKFYILTFIIIVFFLGIIHESGHIIACYLVGGKTLSIGYKDELLGILYVENQYPNLYTRGIGVLGGSLFSVLICLSLLSFNIKRLNYSLLLIIMLESIMWSLSLLIKRGDGWNFCQAFNINIYLILSITLTVSIISYIISMKVLFTVLKGLE